MTIGKSTTQQLATLYAIEDRVGQQRILLEIIARYSPILAAQQRNIPDYDHAYYKHLYELTIYYSLSSYDPCKSSYNTWQYAQLSRLQQAYWRERSSTRRNPTVMITTNINTDEIPQENDVDIQIDLPRILTPMEYIIVSERYWHKKNKRCIMRMYNLRQCEYNDIMSSAIKKMRDYLCT